MIEKALYALLVAADTDAGTRVYPLSLPQNPTLPALTYQRVSTPRDLSHDGDQGYADARVQINCWAHRSPSNLGYDQAKTLADQVRVALNGQFGTFGGVDVGRIQITGDRDEWDPERSFDRVAVDALCAFQEEKPS